MPLSPVLAPAPDPVADSPEPREVEAFRAAVLAKLRYMVAKEPAHARDHDWLIAVSLAAHRQPPERVAGRERHASALCGREAGRLSLVL